MSALPTIPIQPGLVTVEQFEAMDLPDNCEWELIDGTVVSVTFPDLDHVDTQDRLRELFAGNLRVRGRVAPVVRVEYPYVINPRTRCCADVAVVSAARHRANRAHLEGAPELVVEVMSRSNTDKKVDALRARCFAAGCLLFWKVYPRKRTVVVTTKTAQRSTRSREYTDGDTITFELFSGQCSVCVSDIFE